MSLRNALIALLAANLMVFAWTQWIDTEPQLPAAMRTAVIRPATPAVAAAPGAPATGESRDAAVEVAPAPRCVSVGPFRDTAETTQAIQAFRTAGYQPHSRAQEARIEDGYWVFLDAVPSAAEQRRVLANLRRAGITDASAMPDPVPPLVVSVGIFSDRERAEARAQRVRALGLPAKVDVHVRASTFYWLDMQERPGDTAVRLDVLSGGTTPAGGLTITSCPAATSGSR